MNSSNIYSELSEQNDRLMGLKNRLRRVVTRICGNPPPRGGEVALSSPQIKAEPTFLSELESVSSANRDLLLDIGNDLLWLESTFNTTEGPDAPTGYNEPARTYR